MTFSQSSRRQISERDPDHLFPSTGRGDDEVMTRGTQSLEAALAPGVASGKHQPQPPKNPSSIQIDLYPCSVT